MAINQQAMFLFMKNILLIQDNRCGRVKKSKIILQLVPNSLCMNKVLDCIYIDIVRFCLPVWDIPLQLMVIQDTPSIWYIQGTPVTTFISCCKTTVISCTLAWWWQRWIYWNITTTPSWEKKKNVYVLNPKRY